MRPGCVFAVLVTTVLVIVYIFFLWSFSRPPKAYFLVSKVHVGMKRIEVEQVLGPPDYQTPDGKEYCYSRKLSWGILHVYFDEDGKYVRYVYDR